MLEDPTPLCTLPTASVTHDDCSQTVGVWLKLEQRKSPRESGILAPLIIIVVVMIIIVIIVIIMIMIMIIASWSRCFRTAAGCAPPPADVDPLPFHSCHILPFQPVL